MRRVRIGVAGIGHMGKNHVRTLKNESSYFELVGIYDSDPLQTETAAAQYHTRVFSSFDALLDEVEAVVVAVPSSLHRQIGMQAAAHGVHALIEKPLAANSADAAELVSAFQERGLKLQVGHIERFNPVIVELKKLLKSDKVFFLEAHRFGPFSDNGRIEDTSVIEDLLIHDVDLVCYLMEPFQEVEVFGASEVVKTDQYDFSTCLMRFDDRAHAVISASRVSQNKERTLCIHTEDSLIFADLLNKSLTVSRNTSLVMNGTHGNSYIENGIAQKIFVPIEEPLRAELISFYEAIAHDAPIAADGGVGMRAIRLCEEVKERSGQSKNEGPFF